MGKKFGTNTKAEEGRARKVEAKEKEKQKSKAEKEKFEEKKWSEGTKDESKRREEEAKRLEKLLKKQEKKELEERESQELSKYKPSKSKSDNNPEPLFRSKSSNWTFSLSDGGSSSSEAVEKFSASNIDDALLLLESANNATTSLHIVEKHPERRMRAAFCAFEAREMPKLRAENPTMKHSQLLERLHKIWKKSPENPFNQLHVSHNMTQEQQSEIVQADTDRKLDRLRID